MESRNIRIGKKGAGDEEIFRAAKIARCDEFIEKMEKDSHRYGCNGNPCRGI